MLQSHNAAGKKQNMIRGLGRQGEEQVAVFSGGVRVDLMEKVTFE